MGKRVTIILLTLLCLSCGKGPAEEKKAGYDFRKTNWGMSIDEVSQSEKSALVRKIDHRADLDTRLKTGRAPDISLEYKGSIYDLDCSISYGFIDDALVTAHYIIPTRYSLFVYYELKELLAVKYKTLEKEKISFEEEGHDTYKMSRAVFENEKTALILTAYYPDDENLKASAIKKSYVNIDYESKHLKRLLADKKKKALENL
jgi:hypothetical protein